MNRNVVSSIQHKELTLAVMAASKRCFMSRIERSMVLMADSRTEAGVFSDTLQLETSAAGSDSATEDCSSDARISTLFSSMSSESSRGALLACLVPFTSFDFTWGAEMSFAVV